MVVQQICCCYLHHHLDIEASTIGVCQCLDSVGTVLVVHYCWPKMRVLVLVLGFFDETKVILIVGEYYDIIN